jgi:uncharacterized protein
MKRRAIRIAVILLLFPPLLAAVGGWLAGPTFLHPLRRELTPDLIREADADFSSIHAQREGFNVVAPDGITLRGWKVRPQNPNGSWVLVLHGVADNRVGVIGQARLLLRAGYSVVMMDARAHGASDGPMATYGWLERRDTSTIIDNLIADEIGRYTAEQIRSGKWICRKVANVADIKGYEYFAGHPAPYRGQPLHIFALGESMGAGIALQSAGADPRIEAVVAEASFASLREASYDYAGRGQSLAGFPASEVSPEKAVAARAFPVLLICDGGDTTLPCRHSRSIYAGATGPKELWVVPEAFHTAALGYEPEEFQRRVLNFFAAAAASAPPK